MKRIIDHHVTKEVRPVSFKHGILWCKKFVSLTDGYFTCMDKEGVNIWSKHF